MAESGNKESTGQCGTCGCSNCKCGGRKCGGCKFLAGIIVGLLLAGTGFGLYMAGRSHGHQCGMCPFTMQEHGMGDMPGKTGK